MSTRFLFIFLTFLLFSKGSFSNDPYIKIIHKLDDSDPVLSSAMKLFIQDITKDSSREIIIQNNYKFSTYEIDFDNQSLVPIQIFTISPMDVGTGPHYFCFGRLEPDAKDVLLIMTPHALFKKDLSPQGEGLPRIPQKIMEYKNHYPSGNRETQISFVDFAVDIDGDGYDELILPMVDNFGIYKKNQTGFEEIPIPQKELHKTEFNSDKTYVNYWNMDNQLLDLICSRNTKTKSLVLYPENQGERVKDVIHIYKPRTPLSFEKEPDQEIVIKKETSTKYDSFQMIADIDNDGFVDVIFGESNFDMFSPLTILKLYKALPGKTSILEKPDQQIRLKDPNGIFHFNDFSGDGYTDFCLQQFDYNPSSTDDIVEFFVNSYIRYRLNFYYFDPELAGYSSIPAVSFPIRIKRSVYPYRKIKESISLDGDFNGDGLKDILALVSPDRGEIYIQNPKGIDKKPYATFKANNALIFHIDNIDREGGDDLTLISVKEKSLSVFLFGRTK